MDFPFRTPPYSSNNRAPRIVDMFEAVEQKLIEDLLSLHRTIYKEPIFSMFTPPSGNSSSPSWVGS